MNCIETNITIPLYDSHLYLPATQFQQLSLPPRNTENFHGIVIGHGLGSKNPKSKSHLNDGWIGIIVKASHTLLQSTILYTARGHGEGTGWEETAESDMQQFTWSRLSNDMFEIANYFNFTNFIASGSSMGGATALYTTLQYPTRVAGLIMIRPPTAWEERSARKKNLKNSAKKTEERNLPGEKFHFVLLGAATSDLPDKDNVELYASITCPTLLLTVKDDEAHPISTAITLKGLINNSSLVIAENLDEAFATWPDIISKFISSLLINPHFNAVQLGTSQSETLIK